MRIIVGGMLSLPPYSPGTAWDRLQFVLGFREMGHDVYFLEELDRECCVDAKGQPSEYACSVNRRLFLGAMARFGLTQKACQIYDGGRATTGLTLDEIREVARDTDLLLNISGHVNSEIILSAVSCRAYLDEDPVYTQLWRAEYHADLNLDRHDVFFTVGLNIGTPHCPIPDCGIRWHHTLPPVVNALYPLRMDPSSPRFTTVASWGRYGDLPFRGEWLRSKRDEFQRFARLPRLAGQECELVLKNAVEDSEGTGRLREGGWIVTDGGELRDIPAYRRFLSGSRGEIGIAKGAYVTARSGWFGDRAAHYLASGRPVLAQSTGLEWKIPTGKGFLTFHDPDSAAAGLHVINGNYTEHCQWARAFAEEHLDHRKVLGNMLEVCRASERTGMVHILR